MCYSPAKQKCIYEWFPYVGVAGRDLKGMCGRGGQHNTASNTTRMQNGTINKIHGYFGTVNAITWCSSRMIRFTTTLLPFLDSELSTSQHPRFCLSHTCCWQ